VRHVTPPDEGRQELVLHEVGGATLRPILGLMRSVGSSSPRVRVRSNDSGILLPDHDADPERELQGECYGPRSLPGQQQFLDS